MHPCVSVLIPAYNAAEWIEQTIDSVLAQTWPNLEVIIVDDGSSDATLAVAQKFATDERVRVIAQLNQGAAGARNTALRYSQGDFIQFLDADDLLAPDKVEQQIKLLQASAPGYVASGSWARFYQKPEAAKLQSEPLWKDLAPVDWLLCAWADNLMMHPAAWLIPRAIAEAAGPWDEKLSLNDDGEYFCRVILASRGIKFCGEAKSYYRSGLFGSLSDQKSDRAYLSAYRAIEKSGQALLAVEDSDRTRQAIATLFQRFIYESYPAVGALRQEAAVQVKQMGGSLLQPSGSPLFEKLSNYIGWRLAKRIQRLIYAVGYRRWLVHRKCKNVDFQTTSSIATPAHG